MADAIEFPFRITPAGRVATSDQASDDGINARITTIVSVRLGEIEMCPPFGTPDPAFGRLAVPDVQTCLDQYGPAGVTVTDVQRRDSNNDGAEYTDTVVIEWTRSDDR